MKEEGEEGKEEGKEEGRGGGVGKRGEGRKEEEGVGGYPQACTHHDLGP